MLLRWAPCPIALVDGLLTSTTPAGTVGLDASSNTKVLQPLQQHGCSLTYQPGRLTASLSPAMQKRCQRRFRRRQAALRKAIDSMARLATDPDAGSRSNPLLSSDTLPNWDQILRGDTQSEMDTAAYIVNAVTQLIAPAPAANSSGTAGEEMASLLGFEQALRSSSSQLGFNAVVLPLTQIRLRLDSVLQQINHLEVRRVLLWLDV
jgi:hypothetical protein